jgi:hypothetical protein
VEASRASNGTRILASRSRSAGISDDGRFVTFNGRLQAVGPALTFVRDLRSATTQVVSRNAAGAFGYGSEDAGLSGDGLVVAFTSGAGNLVAGDRNGVPDVFARDLSQPYFPAAGRSGARARADTRGPVLSDPSVAPRWLTRRGGEVTLKVRARDAQGVTSVKAVVTGPSGEPREIALTRASGSAVEGTWRVEIPVHPNGSPALRVYEVTFVARDEAGNSASLDGPSFTVATPDSRAQISVQPPALIFAQKLVWTQTRLTVTIGNTGDVHLLGRISALRAPFEVVKGGGDFSVEPHAERKVTVEFRPIQQGVFSGQLNITSNDAARREVTVDVAGTARLRPPTE